MSEIERCDLLIVASPEDGLAREFVRACGQHGYRAGIFDLETTARLFTITADYGAVVVEPQKPVLLRIPAPPAIRGSFDEAFLSGECFATLFAAVALSKAQVINPVHKGSLNGRLTDSSALMARDAGRQVRGVLDPGQAAHDWAATRWLDDAGVELFLPSRRRSFRKLHHKLTVIDDAVVVAGSFNYTAPANDYNDENLFVIGSPYEDLPPREGGPVDLGACAAITDYFRAEIDRIITGGRRYEPPVEPPD